MLHYATWLEVVGVHVKDVSSRDLRGGLSSEMTSISSVQTHAKHIGNLMRHPVD